MATGILGQVAPVAATNTTVFTVAATKVATFNVSIANTTASPITFRLAVAAAASPASTEWLEYDTVIPGYGVFERGGIVAQANKLVVAYAHTAGLSVTAFGFEE